MTAMKLLVLLLLLHTQATAGAQAQAGGQPSLEELFERAVASVTASEWDDAIADLNTILAADASHLPSKFYLAVSFNGSGRADRAIEVYREILAEDESIFEARMNLGARLSENGMREEAVEEFRSAARLAPADPTPTLYRAQVLNQLGRVDDAIQAYQRVLELAEGEGESSAEAYRRLGGLYLHRNQRETAQEMLIEAVRLGVEDASVFVTLGDLRSRADDLENARTDYERALTLDSDNPDIKLRLALVLRDLDLPDEAILLLEGGSGVDELLADSYIAAERFGEAIPIYERLAEGEPDNPDYWHGLGLANYENGDSDRAIPMFERTLGLDPERHEAWGVLASIYHQREDWANAGTMLVNYLEIRPNHVPSIFLLATSYDNLGDYRQALLHYNLFIQRDDGSDDVRSFQVRRRAQSLERLLEDN
jgi:tetratricopeptide (TPR) repeat protein